MITWLRVHIWIALSITVITCICPILVKAGDDTLPFTVPVDIEALPSYALVETTKGSFEIAFYKKQAPITVRNFEYLAGKKFYNGISFHRHIKNYVIQGGAPLLGGKGGPGYTLPPEFSSQLKHVRGTVGMARKPGEMNPERRSNGSQFYITLAPARHLNGLYTVFGQIVQGMSTVKRLEKGDKILSVQVGQ